MDDRQENHAAKGANERKPHVLLMPRHVVLRIMNRKGYIS